MSTPSGDDKDEEKQTLVTRSRSSSSASDSSSDNSSEKELSREVSRRLPEASSQTINGFDDSDFLQDPATPDNLAAGDIRWLYNTNTGTVNVFSKMVEKEKRYEQRLVLPVHPSIRNSQESFGFHLHRNVLNQALQRLAFSPDPNLPVPSSHTAYLSNNEKVYLHDGRYKSEFDEIRIIGRGGFAKVTEALHKVDRQHYAVKRIPIKSPRSITLEKLSQEVTILAKLTKSPSPRIVRYHAAWLEEEYVSDGGRSKQQEEPVVANAPSSPSSSSNEDNLDLSSSSIVFEDTSSTRVNSFKQVSSSVFSSSHVSSVTSETVAKLPGSIHLYEREEEIVRGEANGVKLFEKSRSTILERESYRREVATAVTMRQSRRRRRSKPMTRYILYIQMELCGKTLSEWLLQRNESSTNCGQFECVSHQNNIHILRQILEGIHFVHEQDILHRDLKPLNVFLTLPQLDVKIGDFGLAREVICSEEDEEIEVGSPRSFGRQLSTDVGTSPYIAPEQQFGGDYDSKADMYSFGIIKYEMFHPFLTVHERLTCIKNLREEGNIPGHLFEKWPEEANMIQTLTSMDKMERPSAAEVLNSQCYCVKKEQTKAHLQKQLSNRDLLISEKDRELEELASRNRELDQRLEEKDSVIEERDKVIEEKNRKLQENDKRMKELEEQVMALKLKGIVDAAR